MTDVLILHRIPGHRPGAIVPLDDRLQKHVDAGNAKLLTANGHQYSAADEEPPAPVLTGASTGSGAIEPNGPETAFAPLQTGDEFQDDEDTEDDPA